MGGKYEWGYKWGREAWFGWRELLRGYCKVDDGRWKSIWFMMMDYRELSLIMGQLWDGLYNE